MGNDAEMTETPVKLRPDLEFCTEADSSVVVKDPVLRRFYRFDPVQATVIRLLGEGGDPQSVAAAAAREHQTEVLAGQVEDFAGKLRQLLLLDHPWCHAQVERASRRAGSAAGVGKFHDFLYIKFWAFNPDRLLDAMHGRMRFFFHPAFNAGIIATIAAAIVISCLNAESIFFSMASLFSLYSIPAVLAVVFVVIGVHEFGHGLALKHFGGKVEEMGFMLIYLMPAFYCNVSDAWMLKKRERILVALAGGYVEVFIWALATILWRLLAPETPAAQCCLVVVGFSGLQTLFNFNPLIRLDGYYMLSDWLDAPNLRPKALRHLRERILAALAGGGAASVAPAGRRERRLLLWYGAASAVFSTALLAFMLATACGWLVRNLQSWGVVLSSALLLAAVPSMGREKAQTSRRLLQAIRMRIKRKPLTYAAAALAVAIILLLPWQLKVAGEVSVASTQKALVSPQVEGNLKTIHVGEGDRVRAGQVLAEMENLDLENDYEETRGELAAQRAQLDLLKAGTRPEEVENARRLVQTRRAELDGLARIDEERAALGETVAKRMAELENARLTHERSQTLWREGVVPQVEADRDRTAWEVSRKELAEAQGQLKVLDEQTGRNSEVKRKELAEAQGALEVLLAGSRKEEVRAAEALAGKLAEKLGILGRQKERLLIRSPIDGVVATAHLGNRIGDFLGKGDTFCEVVSKGTLIVEMPVPEKEIGDVRPGFPMQLKFRSAPRRRYETTVKEIAPVAASDGGVRVVVVRGELDDPHGADTGLKAGMTGVGKILCGRRPVFELVSRRLVRWMRTEFWEYLP